MSSEPSASEAPELEAEFSRLFWLTRREHNRLKKKATTNDPAYKLAVAFAKAQAWKWAEDLIEASRLECAGEHEMSLKILAECEVSVSKRHQGLVLFTRGTALAGKGEWDEAIKAFRKAINTPGCDNMGGVWNNLGGAYSAKGDWDEAIKAVSNALHTPGYDTPAAAWYNLGNSLAAKGKLDEAINAYRKALDASGDDYPGRALYGLARAFQIKGELGEAIKTYHKALDTPGYDDLGHAWYGLATALQAKGEVDQAIQAYRKALDTPGHDHKGRVWHSLGTALQAMGELNQAIKAYRKALDMPGSDYRICAWSKLGMAFHAKGDLDQALKAWKNATEDPGLDDPAQSDDNSQSLVPLNMENFKVPRNLVGAESRQAGISSPSFSMAAARSSGPMPDESLNNFTPRAQRVLALAREEAVRLNHYFAGTEHVLLGLIFLGEGVAVNVLKKLGINLANVRETVEKGVGTGPDQRVTRNTTFTPRVKKALALAVKEAKTMNHAYVGTEHILLGLLRERDGVAARVLKDSGVDIEKTRIEILKELDS